MKPSVSRRDVIDGLVEEMRSMGVENPSTRRGKNPGTFHMDGDAFVGRGSVDPEPMQRSDLVDIYETVGAVGCLVIGVVLVGFSFLWGTVSGV